MLNCREVTRLASESLERPLSLRERVGIWIHMRMCSGCRNFNRQVGTLRLLSRRYVRDPGRLPGDSGSDRE